MITARRVPEAERMGFLPAKLPTLYLPFETGAFTQLRAISEGYRGGYWEFYDLDNGGFYMAPDDERLGIVVPTNGYTGEMSGDAAGIVASMFSLNALCWIQPSQQLNDLYYALYDFATEHPEAGAIFGAVD